MKTVSRAAARWLVALALAALGAGGGVLCPAQAQAPGGAVLQGRIFDPAGGFIPHARVTVSVGGATRMATSDAQGRFDVAGLASGPAQVAVEAAGFAPYVNVGLELKANAPTSLQIHLKLGVSQQQVSVSAQASTVNLEPADKAGAVVLSGRALASLPGDPDELSTDLQELAGPGVGGSGGSVYIDGFTRGDIPPKSAIASIQVNNDPFSARYAHMGWGRIQIETKPGAAQLHGDVHDTGNWSQLNSLDPFLAASGTPAPPYHSNIFSASAGGPVSQGLSWFLGFQRRNISNVSVINAQTLDASLQPQTLIATLPNQNLQTAITPRLDYQLAPDNVLAIRYEHLSRSQSNSGVGGDALATQAVATSSGRHNLQIGDTQILNASTINRLTYQFLRFHDNNAAVNSEPAVNVLGAFSGGGSSAGRFQRWEMHNDAREDLSMTRGAHQLDIGGEVSDVSRTEVDTGNFNGSFVFPSLSAYQITEQGLQQGETMAQIVAAGGGPSQFSITAGVPRAHINRIDAAAYATDTWRARPNLSLNLGLRMQSENVVGRLNWAPRLGLAWGLFGSNATVLRAGFGVFYRSIDDDQMIVVGHSQSVVNYLVGAPDFYPNIPPVASLTASAATFPVHYEYSPTLRMPYNYTSSVSLEHQFGAAASLSLSYLHSSGDNQLLTNDANAPLPGTYDPANPASGTRPLGAAAGNIYQYQSAGVFRQNQFSANFKLHPNHGISLSGYYTYNVADSTSAFPANPWNIMADYGRSGWDVRNRLFLGGDLSLPWSITTSPFLVAQSGRPFSVTLKEDLFGTGQQNARPGIATASTPAANVVVTPWGAFDRHPAPGETMVAPNLASGPAAFSLNLRLTKDFGFGGVSGGKPDRRYTFRVGVEGRNVFNNVNLSTPVGDLNSPRFGQSTGLRSGPFSNGAANRRIDAVLGFTF